MGTVENDHTDQPFVTWAGISSAVGGACWAIKGLAILISGDQPPVLFEVAPFFFLIGLLGLSARLGREGGRLATLGVVALGVSATLGAVTWLLSMSADSPRRATASEEEFMPTLLLAFLSLLTAMVLLGIVTRRTRALGDRWSDLPLALAIAAPVMSVAGGALEAINERLLEIPLVLYGVAWMALGYALIRSKGVLRPRVDALRS